MRIEVDFNVCADHAADACPEQAITILD